MTALGKFTVLALATIGSQAVAQTLITARHASTSSRSSLTEAPQQISSARDLNVTADQAVTGKNAQAVTQVAGPGRDAQAAPLSDPSTGRNAVVEPVTGADRCDPSIPRQRRSKRCADIIESRANDYSRPASTELSPEQQLILTREIQGAGQNVADVSRHLANSGNADNSDIALGIAAVALDQSKPAGQSPKPSTPTIDPVTQAVIESIVTNQGTPH